MHLQARACFTKLHVLDDKCPSMLSIIIYSQSIYVIAVWIAHKLLPPYSMACWKFCIHNALSWIYGWITVLQIYPQLLANQTKGN